MKKYLLYVFVGFLIFSCKQQPAVSENKKEEVSKKDIAQTILSDDSSFYYIDFNTYPQNRKELPIGIFDSGTGGLTVFDAIVNFDKFNNSTKKAGSDGEIDFNKESFIYLADQANMPYGNYSKENKVDLLKEHIIKDAQFLMSNKYYQNFNDSVYNEDKLPVKAIVIACNTATAYGKRDIEDFIKKAGNDLKVIGVIDAGVRGALESFNKDEDGIIGVLATAGTVASNGYVKTINALKEKMGFTGTIESYQQGGVGIAGAVDEDPDYFDKKLTKPRDNYKGPGLVNDVKIDKALLDIYNFDFKGGKMLCDSKNVDDCSMMQINDTENYVRYHVVSLMEKIKDSGTKNKLKAVILGCTHFPFLLKEFQNAFDELYNYKDKKGNYVYRNFMIKDVKLIDPSVNTAKELYEYLDEVKLFNSNGSIDKSEFYISVPDRFNKNNTLNKNHKFPYEYKYGRNTGEIQEYVKVVPFSRVNISDDILGRLKLQIPNVYNLIVDFNKDSPKTKVFDNNTLIK
jgi:glutamate racemase